MSDGLTELKVQLKSLHDALIATSKERAADSSEDLERCIINVQQALAIGKPMNQTSHPRDIKKLKIAIQDIIDDLKKPTLLMDIKTNEYDKLEKFLNPPADATLRLIINENKTNISNKSPTLFDKKDSAVSHQKTQSQHSRRRKSQEGSR